MVRPADERTPSLPLAEVDSSGISLGAFDLEDRIGFGGMGDVWKGVHRVERTPVAVKVVTSAMARQPLLLDAFRREVRAVAALSHPCIVEVFDQGMVPLDVQERSGGRLGAGSPYLVMELASRGTLSERRGSLPWSELYGLLRKLLDALAHAHARGLIHRDLKPSNILLSGQRGGLLAPKLSDFGIAHALAREDQPVDESNMILGSPSYMAPEQIMGASLDQGPWTDLYGLGCLVWAMVTGRPPFTVRSFPALANAHLNEAPPAFEPCMSVPPGLEPWLLRLLAKRPEDRFRFASDAAAELDVTARSTSPPAARGASSPPRPPRPPQPTHSLRLPPSDWRRQEPAPAK